MQCNVENNTLLWTNETSQDDNVSLPLPTEISSFENVTVRLKVT